MNIFTFTKKGNSKKINTDTILFNNESISGNPIIVNEQNNYSHFINDIEGTSISLLSDGLGDVFASRLASLIYNENFLDLLELVGEQEVLNWIMHNFIKLEVMAAKESANDKEKSMAGASIAGVLYHKFAGVFVFNAGDAKVFVVDSKKAMQISRDHTNYNVLENCACAGGGHYITIEGARRNKNHNYFIATNSMCDLLSGWYDSAEDGVFNIMSNTEDALKKLEKLTENYNDNISSIGLFNLYF